MLPYWLLLLLPALLAVGQVRPARRLDPLWPAAWWALFLVLVLVIGLRHQVGADWEAYLGYIQRGGTDSFVEALTSKDPAYGLVNWAVGQTGGNIYAVNTVTSCCVF